MPLDKIDFEEIDFNEWMSNPVTKALLDVTLYERTDRASVMENNRDFSQDRMLMMSRSGGIIEAYDALLEITYKELIEQLEYVQQMNGKESKS